MNIKYYKVINISFVIYNCTFDSSWDLFAIMKADKVSFSMKILPCEERFHGLENYEMAFQSNRIHLVRLEKEVMAVDESWKEAIVLPQDSPVAEISFSCHLYYRFAISKHIIQFHSSLLDYKGNGLMFLGPSGIGKTTQAELWNKYRDALIINGDVVFVQETSDAFLGWGTPWHGSSPYCENANVPVRAMIVLKQAEENSIRELTGFEKVTAVSESVFYPRWLEGGMELCLDTLDHLLTAVRVYELCCRPDEEAVRITEAAVFG